MDNEALSKRIGELERRLDALNDFELITNEIEKAFIGKGFISNHDTGSLNGVLIGNKGAFMTAKNGLTGTVYVSNSSGGPVTRALTLEQGVIMS